MPERTIYCRHKELTKQTICILNCKVEPSNLDFRVYFEIIMFLFNRLELIFCIFIDFLKTLGLTTPAVRNCNAAAQALEL